MMQKIDVSHRGKKPKCFKCDSELPDDETAREIHLLRHTFEDLAKSLIQYTKPKPVQRGPG